MPSSKHIWHVPGFTHPWRFMRADGMVGLANTRAEARKLRALSLREWSDARSEHARRTNHPHTVGPGKLVDGME